MTRNQLLFIAAIFAMCSMTTRMKAEDFPAQTLTYNVSWHCSFINEIAAEASIQISDYDGRYTAILDGKSRDIGGVYYCINDTLQSNFIPSGLTIRPASENVLYQSGYYRKPHVNDMTNIYSPRSYRNIAGGGTLSADASTMECVQLTADMLCMFYYAKTVDFERMQQGVAVDVPVSMPDGSERTMQIIYQGITTFNGRPAYNLIANFTYEGRLSSYPININIDTERRVPLSFSASIVIGHVEMILNQ